MSMVKKIEPEPIPVVAMEWWDRRDREHPMTDAQFVEAFCEHVLLTTKDISLVAVRNRAFRFIRNFMSPDLEKQLTEYRKAHT
jgi:hypothetical protein